MAGEPAFLQVDEEPCEFEQQDQFESGEIGLRSDELWSGAHPALNVDGHAFPCLGRNALEQVGLRPGVLLSFHRGGLRPDESQLDGLLCLGENALAFTSLGPNFLEQA